MGFWGVEIPKNNASCILVYECAGSSIDANCEDGYSYCWEDHPRETEG